MEPFAAPAPRHLLVPLDGSRLAEAALPAALALAEKLGARATLLHVLERRAPATIHGDRHLTGAGEAEAYLAGVASRFADAGVSVERHVHPNPEGDVAASVAAHAAEFGVDLIVLCAHGQGGPRGWLSGSLAQQVVRRVTPPLLMVRPNPAASPAPVFGLRSVLVALDGTAEGEAALPTAAALARAFAVPLRLVVVVATRETVPGDRAATARLAPSATTAALDLEQAAAATYLERLRARLAALGPPLAVEVEVGRGDAVRTVTELASQVQGSVLALATHGRAGLDALWAGSVGAKVVTRAAGPLLLVHPEATQLRP